MVSGGVVSPRPEASLNITSRVTAATASVPKPLTITVNGEKIGEVGVKSTSAVEKIGYFDLVWRIFMKFLII